MADRIASMLAELTLDEKISMLAGRDLWSTMPIERLGIPSIKVTDGPNGVRGEDDRHGPNATSFPVGAAMGATFDAALIGEVGRALAREVRDKGADVLLGPTMNIPRVPNAGRNFECFSEDPWLSGTIAAAYIDGLQSAGVGACIKHVVCNDQETERTSIDVVVDDRALREIYLEPFRIAIRQAAPWVAMSSYNTINGVTASEHPLLDEVLRGEYGFDGLVLSDWYGTYSPDTVTSGLDLEMPGPPRWMAAAHVRAALAAGTVTETDIDAKVARLLTLIDRTGGFDRGPAGPERAVERDEDRALVRRVASAASVLLTNDGLLPLASPRRVAVIGELASRTPVVGGGSAGSHRPHRVVSVLEGLRHAWGDDVEVTWSPGTPTWRHPPPMDADVLSHGDGDSGMHVEYFTGTELAGDPVREAVASRSALGFFGPGDDHVRYDDFSLRASARFTPTWSGPHRFSLFVIGRVRLSIDREVVVDAWDDDVAAHPFERELVAGEPVDVTVEFSSVPDGHWREFKLGLAPPMPDDPIAEAAAAARDADVAVVVVGLTDEWESEGFDRADLRLPREQDALVRAVAAAQPDTVVVLTTGSPVVLPWLDEVRAVVQAWYGGQEIGHAVADVLLGHAEPAGRLPLTWPATSQQHPGLLNFPGEAGHVRYGEGVLVGYRGFDHLGLAPLFPFGHGGSYTTFAMGEVAVDEGEATVTLRVPLTNTGARAGSDVLQVYARDIGGVPRRLVGYAKTELAPGETADVAITIDRDRFARWDPGARAWVTDAGELTLEVVGLAGSTTTTCGRPAATTADD